MNSPARRVALTSIVVMVLAAFVASPVAAQPTDLLFSEYIEGSSNNKALEVYNGTGAAVDLTAGQYVIQMYFNGSATAGTTITLTGTVANNDVYVIGLSTGLVSAGGLIPDGVVDLVNSSSWYNGDDAIVLRKGGATGTIVDSIGQVGVDPGTEWGPGRM
jgi:predicted extracellular nuclease